MNMGDACWSTLPVELLEMIDEHIVLFVDKIRFRCVCSYWFSGLSELPNLRQPRSQPPWLLLPESGSGSLCGLYHPFENKVYHIDLPEAGEKVFRGSDFGWVVTILGNGSIYVVNPLSRVRHELPPRYTFPNVVEYRPDKRGEEFLVKSYFPSRPSYAQDSAYVRDYSVPKIALSCNPSFKNDFTAVAILYTNGRSKLAYCKCGDSKWLELDDSFDRGCGDVVFSDEKLYVLTSKGELLICDDINYCPKLRDFVPLPTSIKFNNEYTYLVNSSTYGLMMIWRVQDIHELDSSVGHDQHDKRYKFTTHDFETYKLDMAEKRWIELKSLGHEILFMGLGRQVGDSFSGYKGNRIYFVSDILSYNCEGEENIFDNGVFNVEDKRIDPLGYTCDSKVIWPCPIWIIPNPY